MLVLLQIVIVNALIGVSCYARGLYLHLKSTKEKLENAERTVKYLEKELQEAYKQLEKQ